MRAPSGRLTGIHLALNRAGNRSGCREFMLGRPYWPARTLRLSWNAKRKDTIMGNSKRAIVIGLATAITFGTTLPSSAAPVLSSTAIVGATAPTDVSNVYYRHYRGRGVGLGLGLVGAGIAASVYRNNYYDRGYYRRGYGPRSEEHTSE